MRRMVAHVALNVMRTADDMMKKREMNWKDYHIFHRLSIAIQM